MSAMNTCLWRDMRHGCIPSTSIINSASSLPHALSFPSPSPAPSPFLVAIDLSIIIFKTFPRILKGIEFLPAPFRCPVCAAPSFSPASCFFFFCWLCVILQMDLGCASLLPFLISRIRVQKIKIKGEDLTVSSRT